MSGAVARTVPDPAAPSQARLELDLSALADRALVCREVSGVTCHRAQVLRPLGMLVGGLVQDARGVVLSVGDAAGYLFDPDLGLGGSGKRSVMTLRLVVSYTAVRIDHRAGVPALGACTQPLRCRGS